MLGRFMSSIGILNADFYLLGPKAMYAVPSSTDFAEILEDKGTRLLS
jgi:hypothetical protein